MEIIDEPKKPEFFDLVEYVNRIKLSEPVFEHLQATNENFEGFLKKLREFSDQDIKNLVYLWLDNSMKELISSSEIENQRFWFSNQDLIANDLFFDRLSISEQRIKNIHKYVCNHSKTQSKHPGEYRSGDAWVGYFDRNGERQVYWWGVKPEDIKPFMKSYLEFYEKLSLNQLYSNPFLKSALAHLLFVKIHPFEDGNGRTARIMQNICFTSAINRIYGTKLKLSPISTSVNIKTNQLTYVKRINDITFGMNCDDNEMINRWLDFILNMYDEAIRYKENHLPQLADLGQQMTEWGLVRDERVLQQIEKGEIKKLVH